MSWHEDLRSIVHNGMQYAVVDKFQEEGRTYLGLAAFQDVAEAAAAMDAGRPRPLPRNLLWVEEAGTAFLPLARQAVDLIRKRKGDRALAAFRKT